MLTSLCFKSSSVTVGSNIARTACTCDAATEMEQHVAGAQKKIGYKFRNKKLLEEALTHSSFSDAVSYQRLEFIGDSILSYMISNHLYHAYPTLDPGQLSVLRAANINTEKLARVAVRRRLHLYVHHNSPPLDKSINDFVDAVAQEDPHRPLSYGGAVKAPKILSDIVESIVAAKVRAMLEPIVTPEDLEHQPVTKLYHPVTKLYELCQKNGKNVKIRSWRHGGKSFANVYVDGGFVASAFSDQKYTAKLKAVKVALHNLSHLESVSTSKMVEDNDNFVIERAKHKLYESCRVKKWLKPVYSIEKDSGPPHDKKFICSVQITTKDGVFQMSGDEKPRVKKAENSAASLMIRALQQMNYL
ncbi:hypothetical protein RJT34_10874 [Clitoria ternatea]|uniref:Uncharacterized protein n=1 Tax=Clitoria ternatea TaxID=43366 RepID=A0AAN9JLM8_CLITE